MCQNLNRALLIRPQNSRATVRESFKQLRTRVSVRIFFAGGDHGNLPPYRKQKVRNGRVLTPMVPDL